MIRNGERVSLSTRVAELDSMLPQYLGVSKAVLDNVIFCHQDESLWPLAEPSTLKKKFDEIFEALKYTKAIDNIKVLGKKQKEELAKLKIIEAHAKEDKDKGERAERRSHALADEIEELRAKIREIDRQTKEAQEKTTEAYKQATEFHGIMAALDQRRLEAGYKQSAIDDIEARGPDFLMDDSDADLRKMLDQYEEKSRSYEADIQAQQAKYNNLGSQLQNLERQIGHKQTEQGKYQADKDEYVRQQNQREERIKEAARRHNIRGFDHELADPEIEEFMARLNKMKRDQNATRDRAMDEINQQVKVAQEELNGLNQKKSAYSATRENARVNIARLDKRASDLQREFDGLQIDEGTKVKLESRAQDIEKKLQQTRVELEGADYDKRIQETTSRIRELEATNANLSSELVSATNRATETARVDNIHKSLKDNELSLDTMKGAHNDRITKVLGNAWTVDDLDSMYRRSFNDREAELKEAEQQRDGITRELEVTRAKRSTAQTELNTKKKTAGECQQEVRDALDEEDLGEYDNAVSELESSREILRADSTNYQSMKKYYQDCFDTMTNNNVCRLCERMFRTDKEKANFEKKMRKLLATDEMNVAADLAKCEADLKALKAVRPSYDTWIRLTETEIPSLENELQRLDAAYSDLVTRQEAKDEDVSKRSASKKDVESIASTVQHIKGYVEAISKAKEDLAELTTKQSQSQSVVLRGLQEILGDQRKIKQDSDKLRANLETLTSDREAAKANIGKLELDALDIKGKLSETTHKLQEKANLAGQIEDLRSQVKEQRDLNQRTDKDAKQLGPQISQAQAKLDDVDRRRIEQQRQLDDERNKLDSSIRDLKNAEIWIKQYLDRGGEQRLARSLRELEDLQDEQGRVTNDKSDLASAINQLRDQKINHKNNRDRIDQNSTLR